MAGLSATTAAALGGTSFFSSVFFSNFALRVMQRSGASFRDSSRTLLDPPQYSSIDNSIRVLRSQRNMRAGAVAAATETQGRLNVIVDGLDDMETALTSIQTLVQDTIANPGNAVANQAAIDSLVGEIDGEISVLRSLSGSPTFTYPGIDSRLLPFRVTRASSGLIDANGISVETNVTTAATRATRTAYISNISAAVNPIQFSYIGPNGASGTVDVSPTQATLTDYIQDLSAANLSTVTFNLTGPLGTQLITIDPATQAEMDPFAGGFDAAGTDTIQFTLVGDGGSSGPITIVGPIDRTTALTQINAALPGTGLSAYPSTNPQQISIISDNYGSSAFIALTELLDGGGTPNVNATATVNGTDADVQADVIAAINAVTAMTGVTAIAGTTGDAVTLRSSAYGAASFVTVASVSNPAGEVTLLGDQTVNGTSPSQATVLAAVNALTATTGVVGVASGGNAVTLRSQAYGSSESIATTEIADLGGHLLADATVTGVDAIVTFQVDGGGITTLTGAGREVDFNAGGLLGTFFVQGDTVFNPAVFTILPGDILPIATASGKLVGRANFNSLDYGYLGSAASTGGLYDIDVTSDTTTALSIVNQAITDLGSDQTLASVLQTNVVDPLVDDGESSVDELGDTIDGIQDVEEALQSFPLIRAQSNFNASTLLLSQLSSLFPLSTASLLGSITD